MPKRPWVSSTFFITELVPAYSVTKECFSGASLAALDDHVVVVLPAGQPVDQRVVDDRVVVVARNRAAVAEHPHLDAHVRLRRRPR